MLTCRSRLDWRKRAIISLLLVFNLSLSLPARASVDRTPLKPGFNLFSSQQDIDLGRKFAREVDSKLPMCNNQQVDDYLNALGQKLAAKAPGAKYPYQFKCVNDKSVNAFALPGGSIYVNRGAIEACDDEAQLAAVMAHEISHVALRHGTNQLSKQELARVPFNFASGLLGDDRFGELLAAVGSRLVLPVAFLKFSRTDESQADILGTQILYDSGYDPRAMAQFFEKLEAESKSKPIQFLSDHPNPGNRAERVQEEVEKLGGPPADYQTNSRQFDQIRRIVAMLPDPPKPPEASKKF